MRIHCLSPDSQGRIDGTIQAHLLSSFPDRSTSPHDCDVILVPITTFSDFRFNPRLRDIAGRCKKPYVLLDYTELEHNYFDQCPDTMLFGKNAKECRWLNPHWHPCDDFVRENPPVVYFKRELLAKDATDTVRPIDWPVYFESPTLHTEDEFNARPLEIFFDWGYSSPHRPLLHADIFEAMATHGIGVISEPDHFHGYFANPCARTWASIFAPHYARKPITTSQWYQERAKITVSLPGCGKKCFRHGEACWHTIMALHHDSLAWSYDWKQWENCIRIRPGHEFEDLDADTRRSDLFQIYLAGNETMEKYRKPNYVENYLTPLIEARL